MITKEKSKYVILKAYGEDWMNVDFCIANVDSLIEIHKKVIDTGIFDKLDGSFNRSEGNFNFYADNEEFPEITGFVELEEEWSYIDITEEQIEELQEVDGYYSSYNEIRVYERSLTLKGFYKHVQGEMWAEFYILKN